MPRSRSSIRRCSKRRPISAAGPSQAFWRVTLPLSLPGIAAGALLVFIPMCGEFVIPDLLGGPNTLMIGKVLWDEFFTNRDWPVAAAVAVAMLAVLLAADGPGAAALCAGERHDQPAVAVPRDHARRWASCSSTGRSRRWSSIPSTPRASSRCGPGSRPIGTASSCATSRSARAALVSFEVAVLAATGALVLGTLAGYRAGALSPVPRPHRSSARWRPAPLVMPEVITGLSLLLLFVALEQGIGWPQGARHPHHRHRPYHAGPRLCRGRRRGAARRLRPLARGGGARSRRAAVEGVRRHHPAADRAGAGRRAGCSPSRCRSTIW